MARRSQSLLKPPIPRNLVSQAPKRLFTFGAPRSGNRMYRSLAKVLGYPCQIIHPEISKPPEPALFEDRECYVFLTSRDQAIWRRSWTGPKPLSQASAQADAREWVERFRLQERAMEAPYEALVADPLGWGRKVRAFIGDPAPEGATAEEIWGVERVFDGNAKYLADPELKHPIPNRVRRSFEG